MFWVKKVGVMTVAAALSMSTAAIVGPATASAAASDCAGGRNGFADIPDNLGGQTVEDIPTKGAHYLSLNFGKVAGVTRGWTNLRKGLYEHIPTDASVWLDWSQDGGRTWLQCGPFYNSKGKSAITSAAKETNASPSWVFRAGASVGGEMTLTRWH